MDCFYDIRICGLLQSWYFEGFKYKNLIDNSDNGTPPLVI